ncbi:hypothetical protein MUP05_09890 [Candidatus Bathyarchaeota archaeon]|nr:hypothetical protein [Candidatus Bathyarchaeota archaeon]
MELTRVRIQEERDTVEYSTVESATASLRLLAAKYNLPILDAFRIISNSSVDSIALTGINPLVYLYVRKVDDELHFHVKEGGRSIRFELPTKQMVFLSQELGHLGD